MYAEIVHSSLQCKQTAHTLFSRAYSFMIATLYSIENGEDVGNINGKELGLCIVACLGIISVAFAVYSPWCFLGFSMSLFTIVIVLGWLVKRPSRPTTKEEIDALINRFAQAEENESEPVDSEDIQQMPI